MDFTKWGVVAALATNPVVSLVLCFFVWKLTVDFKEMKKAMYGENGFVTRGEIASLKQAADREHDGILDRIAALERKRRNR